jgi:hypothetical protein
MHFFSELFSVLILAKKWYPSPFANNGLAVAGQK